MRFTFVSSCLMGYLLTSALAEGVTLETDKPVYKVGEHVVFSGSGYLPSGTRYNLTISWENETSGEKTLVDSLVFVSVDVAAEEGVIPSDTSWLIPFDALSGSYIATVYNVTEEGQFYELLSSHFKVNASREAKLDLASGFLDDLVGLIENNVATQGVNQSLLSSLENAASKLRNATDLLAEGEHKRAANQLRAARNMLTAFVHKVVAQAPERIDAALASELVGRAMGLLDKVDSLLVELLEDSIPAGKRLSLNVRRTLTKQELGLSEFVLKKCIKDLSDEELVEFLNSTVARLRQVLNETRSRRARLTEAQSLEPSDLAMELEDLVQVTDKTLHLWELLTKQVEEKGKVSPGLAKRFSDLVAPAEEGVLGARELSRGLDKDIEGIKGKAWGRRGNPPGHEKHEDKGKGGG